MSNELVNYDSEESLLPEVVNPFDEHEKDVITASQFLPRLQLFASSSDAVKDEKIGMNCYGLVSNQEIDELGKEVDIAILSWRPRALDTSDKNNIRASSDPTSELYQEIKKTQDSTTNSGCLYGPEYLVWVPSREKFATLLCGSPTARNEAPKIHTLMGRPATLKSRPIDNGKFRWQGMVVVPCTTPFVVPTKEKINEVAKSFLAPKEILGLEKVKAEELPNRVR